MSNSPQNQNRPAQNMPSSNQPNAGKVGNNVEKDEPTAQKRTGGMKDDDASSTPGNKTSDYGNKSSKA